VQYLITLMQCYSLWDRLQDLGLEAP